MDDHEARFTALFAATSRPVLAYVLRRVADRADAADVVADTYLVAWRRVQDVPDGDDARLWLFGVARRVLANHRRGDVRRTRLAVRLRDVAIPTRVALVDDDPDLKQVRDALAQLHDDDRELLRLAAWEELSPAEIAVVLGVPPATARTRLHRARNRLRAELARSGANGHVRTEHVRTEHVLVRDWEHE